MNLEDFWENLLSREPKQIRLAYRSLDATSKKEVLIHLQKMVSENGWLPQQVASARAALETVEKIQNEAI
jgi:hypothetical protein